MKTEEARTIMVNAVQTAFAQYPTYESLPRLPSVSSGLVFVEYPDLEPFYVEALYKACVDGAVPAGRFIVEVNGVVQRFIVKG